MLLQLVRVMEESKPLDYRAVAGLLQTCKELRAFFLHRKATPEVLTFIHRLMLAARSDRFGWYVHYGQLPFRDRFGMYIRYGWASFMVTDSRAQVRFVVGMQGEDRLRIECCKPFPQSKERIRAQHCKPTPRRYVMELRVVRVTESSIHGTMDYTDRETGVSMHCYFNVDPNHPWCIHSHTWNTAW
jgi:hypothetical protein